MFQTPFRIFLVLLALVIFAGGMTAQADDICREQGEAPTRELNRQNRTVPFIYGVVLLKGLSHDAKRPKVVVIYSDSLQPSARQLISESGNYCFKILGTGGKIMIEIDGLEAARKSVSDLGTGRQREDFEIFPSQVRQTAPPGVISTKFSRPRNEKTSDLYKKAAETEAGKDRQKAIKYVNEILAIDPADFIAWAKLGSLYFETNSVNDAETAFRRSIELKPDYTPAMISLGMIRAVQKDFDSAIQIFKQATAGDPTSATSHRLLGEAYLQKRQGTLGLESLNEAIRLDPTGMAECHLLIARLYDLAGAKNLATREYKAFLTKVPKHADKKKFEQYIKDNPE